MPLDTATRVGVYEIRSMIGAGGMGEVYRASDPRLKREVAVKVLPAAFAADSERMRRFEFEAQAAGRLNHPNVLSVYDVGVHGEAPYLVSELLEGESLRERLRAGRLSPQRAVDYARQTASGLAAAHAAGIVHRDLKPENLFITKDGRVKILDFGLAKETDASAAAPEQTQTSPGVVLGTVAYMAPEQIRGQKVDHRADIFSFGCVLHEMLTGERPFQGESAVEAMHATLNAERPELVLESGMAPALDRIVGHCLEKQPEARYQSAQDVAFDLASISEISQAVRAPQGGRRRFRKAALAGFAAVLAAVAGAAFLAGRVAAPQSHPTFQRLTFRRGTIDAARFAPDGRTIVYSAIWEDEPADLFTMRLESPESGPMGFRGAGLLGVSRSGEIALALEQKIAHSPFAYAGVLARVPFSGGSPRSMEEHITAADWTPDGREIVLVRQTDFGQQLEFPQGNVVYKTAGYVGNPRISPAGDRVAFWEHPLAFDNSGVVAVVDKSGSLKKLTARFNTAEGLAWGPNGNEIWFSAAGAGAKQDVLAVTLNGRQRVVYRQSGSVLLHDVSRDGRALLANEQARMGMTFRGPGDSRERELSWLDWSLPTGLTNDGKLVVFSETGEGAGGGAMLYLRETGGAPAVKLGTGSFATFSPDGKFVVSTDPEGAEIAVYPVSTGTVRKVRLKGYTMLMAGLLPDGKRIWFDGNEPSKGRRLYLTSVDGAAPQPIIPEEAQAMPPYVADGRHMVALVGGRMVQVPLAGGKPEPLPGVEEGERVTGWGADSFFVFRRSGLPLKVYRVDRRSGARTFVAEIGPSERAGIGRTGLSLIMTPDGKSYVYSTRRNLSELYLVGGLR